LFPHIPVPLEFRALPVEGLGIKDSNLIIILETDFRCLSFDICGGCLQEFLLFLEVEHAGDDGGRELLYFIVVLQYFVVVCLAGETDFVFGRSQFFL